MILRKLPWPGIHATRCAWTETLTVARSNLLQVDIAGLPLYAFTLCACTWNFCGEGIFDTLFFIRSLCLIYLVSHHFAISTCKYFWVVENLFIENGKTIFRYQILSASPEHVYLCNVFLRSIYNVTLRGTTHWHHAFTPCIPASPFGSMCYLGLLVVLPTRYYYTLHLPTTDTWAMCNVHNLRGTPYIVLLYDTSICNLYLIKVQSSHI